MSPERAAAGPDRAGRILWPEDPDAGMPSRAGLKAATVARLARAGLPVPEGFCVAVEAYRTQLEGAGVAEAAERVASARSGDAARLALQVRLGLLEGPLAPSLAEAVRAAHARLATEGGPVAVRSSALHEGGAGTSFAGQLETFLGVEGPDDLVTAIRACWASLWARRAVGYARERGVEPSSGGVAVLVQRLVPARAAGGALSAAPGGAMALTAAWGLGPVVAHGAVVPDRYLLRRDGLALDRVEPGRKPHALGCRGGGGLAWEGIAADRAAAPCLSEAEALALGRLVLEVETVLGGPVEIEWALDDVGFHVLQARPVTPWPAGAPSPPSGDRAGWAGQPGAAGLAVGPARVVESEEDLHRVRLGEILVTRVPGPAVAAVLPRVVGVVAELGGSTSHLAALARERGIPAVLGVADATRRIADGTVLIVDGGAGIVYPVGSGDTEGIGPGERARA